MKKKKIYNKKNSKKEDSPKENYTPVKVVGTYHDFLIFDKAETNIEQNYYFENTDAYNNSFLKDWLILQREPNPNKSRFADLFDEIVKNDRKAALEEQNKSQVEPNQQNKINIINNNNINNSNNINNNIYNENIINNNLTYNNINNINNDNNIINDNKIKNDNIFINNYNNNIINNNNININNNLNNNKINLNNNINHNNCINNNTLEQIDEVEDEINGETVKDNTKNINKNIKEENNIDSINSSRKNIPNFPNHKSSIYSNSSSNIGRLSTLDSDYTGSNNNLIALDKNSIVEKSNSQLSVNIKRIIFLEDRRNSLMIKNIPNKFSGDFLLKIIDQDFKGAYNIFILPTDSNKYKNFGYAFINFNCCYYIPNFYYSFNGKKWSNTNSQKVCEITYSKIQGKKSLINHYQSKIIFQSDSGKNNNDLKFKIPNDYKSLFKHAFPLHYIEEHKFYFLTKLPNKK